MEPPSRHQVEIVADVSGRQPTALLRRGLLALLARHCERPSKVCVLLTDEHRLRELNRKFRNVDESTDVLSFASPVTADTGRRTKFLGDVAISVPYASRQAELRGLTLQDELALLAIHGTLHLVGFDDEEPVSRAVMQEEMASIALDAGITPVECWTSVAHGSAALEAAS